MNNQKSYNPTQGLQCGLFIGLMSGTSADALDAVLMDIGSDHCHWLEAVSLPINDSTRKLIHQLVTPGFDEINLLHDIEEALTDLSCLAVKLLCQKANIEHSEVVAIGSHGQTLRHRPPLDKPGFSLQVGNPSAIAESTGITTVADFRRRDMSLGGQGAPLVPAFHQAVFSASTPRAIINIGGVANITWLGNDSDKGGTVQGFDIGPGNNLMDAWCQAYHQQTFDKNGELSQKGTVNHQLLSILLNHPFYSQPTPKSTGRELFNLDYVNGGINELDHQPDPFDVLATLVQLTSTTITQALSALDEAQKSDVYICGGGALNPHLIARLTSDLTPRRLYTTESLGLHPQWVEGAAFAWLAYRCINGLPGNLPLVTGASRECILGGVYQA